MRRATSPSLTGAVFLLSVFGPMIALAVLWAIAAGAGGGGADADALRAMVYDIMVWVLLGAGAVLVAEEALLALGVSLGRFPPR